MTVVNTTTGEVMDTLTRDDAERLSIRIGARLDAIADNYVAVMPMIREAIARHAHGALGYRSAGEYVSDRFGAALSKLGVEVRREVVRELTEAGLSTRAIAPVVGVNHSTVVRDVARGASAPPQTSPAGLSAAGSDGAVTPETNTGAGGANPPAPRPVVVGIDGKAYPQPKPKLSPVPKSDEWDDQDRAEELALNLAQNLSLAFAYTYPERRAEYLATWAAGIREIKPLGHQYVTPKHMRDIAAALTTFADEWENNHV